MLGGMTSVVNSFESLWVCDSFHNNNNNNENISFGLLQ